MRTIDKLEDDVPFKLPRNADPPLPYLFIQFVPCMSISSVYYADVSLVDGGYCGTCTSGPFQTMKDHEVCAS